MRSLSRTDAVVVASLLASGAGSVEEQIRSVGLPRRTFQTARRRALLRGWVQPRWVPDPSMLPGTRLSVALAQPFLDAAPAVLERWRRLPRLAVLWSTPETLLAVRLVDEDPTTASAGWPLAGPDRMRAFYELRIDPRRGGAPVFFDFEGAWARLAATTASPGYPRAWTPTGFDRGGASDPLAQRSLRELFLAVAAQRSEDDGGHLLRGALLRRRARRLAARGWIERRTFLDPVAVADSVDEFADRVAFVYATRSEESSTGAILDDLRGGAGIAPFLAVGDERSILLGVLTADRIGGDRPAGGPTALAVLRRSASGIVTIREPLATLHRVVDYRFDRWVEEPNEPGPSTARV